jgi:hypothetical protein
MATTTLFPAAPPAHIALRPHQGEAITCIRDTWEKQGHQVLISLATGCHRAGQGILMVEGSMKPVEQVVEGDLLMGPGSRPRKVLSLIRGQAEMYEVRPVKGKPWVVNKEHILSLIHPNRTSAEKAMYPYQKRGGIICDVSLAGWVGWAHFKKQLYQLFGPRPSTAEPYRACLLSSSAGPKARATTDNSGMNCRPGGFIGSSTSAWKLTRSWAPPPTPQAASPPPSVPARPAVRTVRQVAWPVQKQGPQKACDLAYREAPCQACPELAIAARSVQSFGSLMRERQPAGLDGWLAQAERSGLRELRRIALGVRRDDAAVRAAPEEPWSQGPTERHIQRLKTLQRQTSGRASFGLLHQRVLEPPEHRTTVLIGCYRAAR